MNKRYIFKSSLLTEKPQIFKCLSFKYLPIQIGFFSPQQRQIQTQH